jgi:hypothetical protein
MARKSPLRQLGTAQLVDPGTRQVVGRRGEQEVAETVTLAEGESRSVTLQFGPAEPGAVAPAPEQRQPPADQPAADEPAPSSTACTLGWVGVGVGSAGVALWAVTGAMAQGKYTTLMDESCETNPSCEPDKEDDVSSYNSLRTWSTVGFWGGMPVLAAGVATLVLAQPSQERASESEGISAWVGLGSVGVSGRFR